MLNGAFENTTATVTSARYGQLANWSNGGPSAIGDSIVLPSWYTLGLVPRRRRGRRAAAVQAGGG